MLLKKYQSCISRGLWAPHRYSSPGRVGLSCLKLGALNSPSTQLVLGWLLWHSRLSNLRGLHKRASSLLLPLCCSQISPKISGNFLGFPPRFFCGSPDIFGKPKYTRKIRIRYFSSIFLARVDLNALVVGGRVLYT